MRERKERQKTRGETTRLLLQVLLALAVVLSCMIPQGAYATEESSVLTPSETTGEASELGSQDSASQTKDPVSSEEETGSGKEEGLSEEKPSEEDSSEESFPNSEEELLFTEEQKGNDAIDDTLSALDAPEDEEISALALAGDTTWYTEAAEGTVAYTLDDADDLAGLAVLVNAGTDTFSGKTITLGADIDLASEPWTPIGSSASVNFQGTFDGAGKTVSNLYIISPSASYQALFGYVRGATIKNITVNGSVSGYMYSAGIAAYAATTIFGNCVNNVEVTGAENYTGGIAAYATATSFYNCVNQAKLTGGGPNTGGITAYALGGTASAPFYITACTNFGDISGVSYVGGIAGSVTAYGNLSRLTGAGTITATASYSGGLVGQLNANSILNWSVTQASATVNGAGETGGLVGRVNAATSSIQNSYALSAVSGANYVGGIAGRIAGTASKNCFYYNTDAGVIGTGASVSKLHSGLLDSAGFYYLSDVANGISGKTAEDFTSIDMLAALQGNVDADAPSYWAAGTPYPTIAGEVQARNCRVGITLFVASSAAENHLQFKQIEGLSTFGTPGESEYLYAAEGTVIALDVSLAEDFEVQSVPDGAINKTEKVAGDPSAGYDYTITVGQSNIDIPYQFVKATEADTAWYNAADSEFTVTTEAQLRGLAHLVNVGIAAELGATPTPVNFAGKTITLGADINLVGGAWIPIGTSATSNFQGTFDGAGKTISGLSINNPTADYQGLFGYVQAATIKNVTVAGAVMGKQYSAGIAGYATATSFEGCINRARIQGTGNYAGGIVGYALGGRAVSPFAITNCDNFGAISGAANVGGIAGCVTQYGNLTHLSAAGTVTSTGNYSGGLVGYLNANSKLSWSVTQASATVVGGGNYVGGLVGSVGSSSSLQNSYALCDVRGVNYVGGIAGRISGSTSKNCFSYNTGAGVSGTGTNVSPLYASQTSVAGYYYLSDVASGSSAKTAEQFSSLEFLSALQSAVDVDTANYWAAGTLYPTIVDEVQARNCRVAITLFIQSAAAENRLQFPQNEAIPTYGIPGESEYLYATEGTEIVLNVSLAEGFEPQFSPDGLVSKVEKVAGDPSAGYDYILTVGQSSVELSYQFVIPTEVDTRWYNETDSEFNITTEAQLRGLAQLVNVGIATEPDTASVPVNFAGKTICLGADINLVGGAWMPIGTSATAQFQGTFDGADKSISGISINNGTAGNQGLFGYTNAATIKNVTVNGKILGGYSTGGIAGNATATSFENCANKAQVFGSSTRIGGIVGYALGGTVDTPFSITNCENLGEVLGGGQVGGIAGSVNAYGNLTRLSNAGAVTGTGNYTGGLVGVLDQNSILNWSVTQAEATVSGTAYVGGLVGSVGYTAILQNSYALCAVSGNTAFVSGIAGTIANTASTSCFYYNNSSAAIAAWAGFYYLSETVENSSTITAEQFASTDMLSTLQSAVPLDAPNYWAAGELYPIISNEEQARLYRVDIALFLASAEEENDVRFAVDEELLTYGTPGVSEYLYATESTEINLDVSLADGFEIEFTPEDSVVKTEKVAGDPTAGYDYSITVGQSSTSITYMFAKASEIDTSWYNETDSEFVITTEAQLRGLAILVNEGIAVEPEPEEGTEPGAEDGEEGGGEQGTEPGGEEGTEPGEEEPSEEEEPVLVPVTFEGKTIRLGADIDLIGGDFTPIGIGAATPFAGTFDGAGKAISYLHVPATVSSTQTGLFGTTAPTSTIQNLTVRGAVIVKERSAGVVANNQGRITGVTSEVSLLFPAADSGVHYAGGIAGYSTGTIENCLNLGTIAIAAGGYYGGIAGYSTAAIAGSANYGSIMGSGTTSISAGGIVGHIAAGSEVRNTTNTAELNIVLAGTSGDDRLALGGIAGASNSYMVQNINTGAVSGERTGTVYDSSTTSIGGILGYGDHVNNTVTFPKITESYNAGAITARGDYYVAVGGLTGRAEDSGLDLENCYNTGGVYVSLASSFNYAGGLYGQAATGDTTKNCYSVGSVSGGGCQGAITGGGTSTSSADTYENVYYPDSITIGARDGVARAGITVLSDEAMKAPEFAATLGSAFFAVADNYPKLSWTNSLTENYVAFNYKESEFYKQGAASGLVADTEARADTIVKVALNADGTITRPADPVALQHFTFAGWFEDLADAEPFDFTQTVASGTTLYAKWVMDSNNVTYHLNYDADSDGTDDTITVAVPLLATAEDLALEKREGYEFVAWYQMGIDGKLLSTPYNHGTQISAALDLYALWQDGNIDYEWYTEDPSATEMFIGNRAELRALAYLVNGEAPQDVASGAIDFSGVTIILTADIDLTQTVWTTMIGQVENTPFKGTLNGNEHTITGITRIVTEGSHLTASSSFTNNQGFFGYLNGAQIESITLTGEVSGGYNTGGIASKAENTVFNGVASNIYVSGRSGVVGAQLIGGFVGYATTNTRFIDCVNTGTVSASGAAVGGFVGRMEFALDTTAFLRCTNEGDVTGSNSIGGLAGSATLPMNHPSSVQVVFEESLNTGKIAGVSAGGSGGLLGDTIVMTGVGAGNISLKVMNCRNFGAIIGERNSGGYGENVGGLVGGAIATFVGCSNVGSVTGPANVGGIIGNARSVGGGLYSGGFPQYSSIDNCENTGEVRSEGYSGGIAGGTPDSFLRLSNLTNSGAVSGGSHAGGILGYFPTTANLSIYQAENLHNSGAVSGTRYVGGVLAYANLVAPAVLKSSSNSGAITLSSETAGDTGGIAGFASTATSLEGCFNTGTLTLSSVGGTIGGIAGSAGNISTSYNTGAVSATHADAYAAGIVGIKHAGASITCTHNLGTVSGITASRLGAIVGSGIDSAIGSSYYLAGCVMVDGTSTTPVDAAQVIEKSASAFSQGEVAYLLDSSETDIRLGIWYQADYPSFDSEAGKAVYKADIAAQENGSITTEAYSAESAEWYYTEGTQIEVSVTSAESYVLRLLSVKDAAGTTLTSVNQNQLQEGKWTFTMPAGDVSLSSEFMQLEAGVTYTVNFYNEGVLHSTAEVISGNAIVLPTEPEKAPIGEDSFAFVGWCADEALENLYDVNTLLTGDLTLYAKFRVFGAVNVSFDLNYPEATDTPEPQSTKQGLLIVEPAVPTRASELAGVTEVVRYDFLGWYTAVDASGILWDFAAPIPGDTTETLVLYAHWETIDLLEGTDISIPDLAVLERLAANVAAGKDYAGSSYVLTSDIDLTPTWQGIGTNLTVFNGSFDGGGKTITVVQGQTAPPFFNLGTSGVVENLKVYGDIATLSGGGNDFKAGIVYHNRGTVNNCSVDLRLGSYSSSGDTPWQSRTTFGGIANSNYQGATITGCTVKADWYTNGQNMGGIVGYNYGSITDSHLAAGSIIKGWQILGGIAGYSTGSITNCSTDEGSSVVARDLYESFWDVGGIVGEGTATSIVVGCTNYADVSSEVARTSRYAFSFGGIAGTTAGTISECTNYGDVYNAYNNIGGIAGQGANISSCVNYGTISHGTYGGMVMGGIAGGSTGTITECRNEGTVSAGMSALGMLSGGQSHAGGIIGSGASNGSSIGSPTAIITNCVNIGTVTGTGSFVGGIAGHGVKQISMSISSGAVSGANNVGGIVGGNVSLRNGDVIAGGATQISNCYNTSTVYGSGYYAGGIVGLNTTGSSITNSFYYNASDQKAPSPISGGVTSGVENISNCYYLAGSYSGSRTGTAASAYNFTTAALAASLDTLNGIYQYRWVQGSPHPVFGIPYYPPQNPVVPVVPGGPGGGGTGEGEGSGLGTNPEGEGEASESAAVSNRPTPLESPQSSAPAGSEESEVIEDTEVPLDEEPSPDTVYEVLERVAGALTSPVALIIIGVAIVGVAGLAFYFGYKRRKREEEEGTVGR